MSEQYEVLAVRYGTRQASAAEVFLNYHVYHEPDRPLGMDYFFWVARNPARSVVIDTGFSPAGGAARGRTMLMDTVPALRRGRDRPGRRRPGRPHPRALRPHRRAAGLRRNRRRGHHDQGRVRLLDRADGPPRPVRAHHRGQRAGPPARAARGRAADPGRPDPPDRARHRADPGRRAHPGPGHRHRGHGRRAGRPGLGRGALLRGAGAGPAVLHRGQPRGHVRRLRPDPRARRRRRPRRRRARPAGRRAVRPPRRPAGRDHDFP